MEQVGQLFALQPAQAVLNLFTLQLYRAERIDGAFSYLEAHLLVAEWILLSEAISKLHLPERNKNLWDSISRIEISFMHTK